MLLEGFLLFPEKQHIKESGIISVTTYAHQTEKVEANVAEVILKVYFLAEEMKFS